MYGLKVTGVKEGGCLHSWNRKIFKQYRCENLVRSTVFAYQRVYPLSGIVTIPGLFRRSPKVGQDLGQKGKIWDLTIIFSQNVLKMIFKSARFVPFGGKLPQFVWNVKCVTVSSSHPWVAQACVPPRPGCGSVARGSCLPADYTPDPLTSSHPPG